MAVCLPPPTGILKTKSGIKPYYSRRIQDWVVDEMCTCGHMRSDHGSLLKKLPNGKMLRLSAEGNCCGGHCECLQYTFARHVGVEEYRSKTDPHNVPE